MKELFRKVKLMNEKNSGAYRLAAALKAQMQKQAEQPIMVELGEIDSNYNLKTDTFSELIPRADYMVCRSIKSIVPGDRVLVFWIGADAVVADVVMAADEL